MFIKIVTNKQAVELNVDEVWFVKDCPYNGHKFTTTSRVREYCSNSHRTMRCNKHHGRNGHGQIYQ